MIRAKIYLFIFFIEILNSVFYIQRYVYANFHRVFKFFTREIGKISGSIYIYNVMETSYVVKYS